MSTDDTLVIALVTVIHVATLIVMLWIRFRRTPGDGLANGGAKIEACAVCGEPATNLAYDGLDPDERRDLSTGRAWSPDITHYRPVCAAHDAPQPTLAA